ncbi:MAG: SDR family oxidoreductase [Sphingomonadales bacterium]
MTKQAIVTGGANGIGAAIVAALDAAGYRVGVFDLKEEEVARCVGDHANRVALVGSVADEAQVAAAFDRFDAVPDLLVNNAGIGRFAPLVEQSVADFRAVVDVNLTGVYICTREAVRRMTPKGAGHVVSLSSINGHTPAPGCGAYAATKSGVMQLTRQFALECSNRGIRFNSIAPGFIDGGMSAPFFADDKVRERRRNGVPLKRLGTVADIANAVLMLDSPQAGYINGHELVVDGGVVHSLLLQLPRE